MTAALQIVGAALIVCAAAFVSLVLAVFVAGLFCVAFGIWDEVG